MNSGRGRALLSETRIRIPDGIEEDEERADIMLRGNLKESVHAFLEAFWILLPEEIVEEDAHGVHAERFGPAKLEINASGIEGVRLPHFDIVDRRGGNVIAADQPGLAGAPIGCGLFWTLVGVGGG